MLRYTWTAGKASSCDGLTSEEQSEILGLSYSLPLLLGHPLCPWGCFHYTLATMPEPLQAYSMQTATSTWPWQRHRHIQLSWKSSSIGICVHPVSKHKTNKISGKSERREIQNLEMEVFSSPKCKQSMEITAEVLQAKNFWGFIIYVTVKDLHNCHNPA